MFLPKLFRHSKALFLALVGFVILFGYLNLKWGVTATPIYQFGMFSGIEKLTDTQQVYYFIVNSKPVSISHLPFPERDQLLASLGQYRLQSSRNPAAFGVIRALAAGAGVAGVMKADNYINHFTEPEFARWYIHLFQKYSGIPTRELIVYTKSFIRQKGKFIMLQSLPNDTLFVNR